MSSLGSLDITVNVVTQRAEKALESVAKGFANVQKSLDQQAKASEAAAAATEKMVRAINDLATATGKAKGGMQGMTKSIKHIGATLSSLHVMYDTVTENAKEMFDQMSEGARRMDARKFFEDQGKAVQDFQKVVGGIVSDASMIQKVNMANTMGISDEDFKTLAKVAQAASIKFGQSFDYMLQSITLGSARGSKLLLDNLGIIINTQQAYQNFAKKIKAENWAGSEALSVKELVNILTDAQKKTAVMEEAMRIGGASIEEMGDMTENSGAKFERFAAKVENTWNKLWEAMAKATEDKLGASWVDSVIESIDAVIDHLILRSNDGKASLSDLVKTWGGVVATGGGAALLAKAGAAGLAKLGIGAGAAAAVGAPAALIGTLVTAGLATAGVGLAGFFGNKSIDKQDKSFEADAQQYTNTNKFFQAFDQNTNIAKIVADSNGNLITATRALEAAYLKTLPNVGGVPTQDQFQGAKAFAEELAKNLLVQDLIKKTKSKAKGNTPNTEGLTPEQIEEAKKLAQAEADKRQRAKEKAEAKRLALENKFTAIYDKYQSYLERYDNKMSEALDTFLKTGIRPTISGGDRMSFDQFFQTNRSIDALPLGREKILAQTMFDARLNPQLVKGRSLLESGPNGIGPEAYGSMASVGTDPAARYAKQAKEMDKVTTQLGYLSMALSSGQGAIQAFGEVVKDSYRQFLEKNTEVVSKALSTTDMGKATAEAFSALGVAEGDAMAAVVDIVVMLLSKVEPLVEIFDIVLDGLGRFLNQGIGPTAEALIPLAEMVGALLVSLGALLNGLVSVLTQTQVLDVLFAVIEIVVAALTSAIIVIVGFFNALGQAIPWIDNVVWALRYASEWLIKSAVELVNNMLKLFQETMRKLPGNDKFEVELLEYSDFVFDNTEATKENTKAVNNLNEELRNLPSGYKIGIQQYNATTPLDPALVGRGGDQMSNAAATNISRALERARQAEISRNGRSAAKSSPPRS